MTISENLAQSGQAYTWPRVVDSSNNRTIGWVIGNRDAKTFRRLYEKLKDHVKHYYTDNWDVYRKVIPGNRLTQGKKHTIWN